MWTLPISHNNLKIVVLCTKQNKNTFGYHKTTLVLDSFWRSLVLSIGTLVPLVGKFVLFSWGHWSLHLDCFFGRHRSFYGVTDDPFLNFQWRLRALPSNYRSPRLCAVLPPHSKFLRVTSCVRHLPTTQWSRPPYRDGDVFVMTFYTLYWRLRIPNSILVLDSWDRNLNLCNNGMQEHQVKSQNDVQSVGIGRH